MFGNIMTKYMITWNHKSEPIIEVCRLCKTCAPDGCGYTFEQAGAILIEEMERANK
jgi:hypothetical protein